MLSIHRIFRKMIDIQEFLWRFSIISLAVYYFQGLKNTIFMSLTLTSPTTPSSSSPSSPLPWIGRFCHKRGATFVSDNQVPESTKRRPIGSEEYPHEDLSSRDEHILEANAICGVLAMEGSDSSQTGKIDGLERSNKLRKRPAKLVLPEYSPVLEFTEMGKKLEKREFEVEGRDFFLASKKGRRSVMEDGYGVMLDIFGDPKQAFFAVIDGHGGRAAADYVAENLGKNVVKELERVGREEEELETAIRGGYSVTDKEFLVQGLSGGACAASVLLKNGELHVANVGDCRVVLSRKGAAFTLTNDHRLSREDERSRIEKSGGYVHCRNGVWRVNGSLAVSRAIGDLHLKEWIISEPEIEKLSLTSDCEFLIIASDGLWDKVNDQEAVDVVLRHKNSVESCRKLVDISSSRGNIDDVTVMVINLQKFLVICGV